jgi:hypothetical protein
MKINKVLLSLAILFVAVALSACIVKAPEQGASDDLQPVVIEPAAEVAPVPTRVVKAPVRTAKIAPVKAAPKVGGPAKTVAKEGACGCGGGGGSCGGCGGGCGK